MKVGKFIRTKKTLELMRQANLGKKASMETRIKMSATRKGRPVWNAGTATPYLKEYTGQKKMAHYRNIPFELTYKQWMSIWTKSGKLQQRGRKRGQYVMARKGDKGAYSKGNVRIITNTENQNEAILGKKRGPMSAVAKARISAAKLGVKHASLHA